MIPGIWESYNVVDYANEPEVTGSDIVTDILDTYSIPIADFDVSGGTLAGIDIKSADALSVIKMALTEAFAKGTYSTPIELTINDAGEAELIRVGSFSGNLSEIYTKIQTSTYNIPPTSVKLTGKKPRPSRTLGSFINLLEGRLTVNNSKLPLNSILPSSQALIWDTSQMVNDCPQLSFKRHATITFKDPNLDAWPTDDGIEGIFTVDSVWQKVIGWVWYLDPGSTAETTKVTVKDTATVPILIGSIPGEVGMATAFQDSGPDLGQLIKRVTAESFTSPELAGCFEGQGTEVTCGDGSITIMLPEFLRFTNTRTTQVDNFVNISKIYIVGQTLDLCMVFPASEEVVRNFISAGSPDARVTMLKDLNNIKLFVGCNDLIPKVYSLEEGIDYGIGYNIDGSLCLQLVNNSYSYDFLPYGAETDFNIIPACQLATYTNSSTGRGSIIPGRGKGYLVQQLWAEAEFTVPSIEIYDPYGNALQIANAVRLEVAPILMDDPPAPIAINGDLINLEDTIRDSDPTTTQNFEDTEYEQALRAMNGTQVVDLNMATLDESETQKFCELLYNMYNDDSDLEINYVCGPEASPRLGGTGEEGGIINAITYSYSDMGSYTISVTEGPMLSAAMGLSSITGGDYVKQSESVTANGVVIQDEGNSVRYKVLVDGIGIVTAYSGVSQVIRVGDNVTVRINNVPVEN